MNDKEKRLIEQKILYTSIRRYYCIAKSHTGENVKQLLNETIRPFDNTDINGVRMSDGPDFYTQNCVIEVFTVHADSNRKGSGIYIYVLSNEEKHLSIRAFDKRMRRYAYELQKGLCKKCGKHFELEEMQADHITPWSKGGKTIQENCQMLCADCNRKKSNI